MRLPQDKMAKIKTYVHGGQGVLVAIAWLMCIIIFTREGHSDGRVGWNFGLCWLTIPILVYLVMVPMWSRARRFSNIYAFAALDAASVILWLSAWASMASYVSQGKGKGKDDKKDGCDNFKYGSPGRCKISQGVTIVGVFVMLSFIATAFVSVKAVMHFRSTGEIPQAALGNDNTMAKQTQDAFSSNMRNDDPFDDNQENLDPRRGGGSGYQPARRSEEDEYAPMYNNNDHEDLTQVRPAQPSGPLGSNSSQTGGVMHDYDTSYAGAYGQHSSDGGYGSGSHGR